MSSTIQISLNTEREIQIGKIKTANKKYQNLVPGEIAKLLLFEKIDELSGKKP